MTKDYQSGIFYGWWVVAACCLFLLIYVGLTVYGFSLFVKPIAKELGFGRGPLMLGFTSFMLLGGIVAPFVGKVVDSKGASKIMAMGGLLLGLAFIVLSRMNTIYTYFFGNIIMGFGAAFMGQVPCSTVVAQWFEKKRGTAMGIMTAGIGIGGLTAAPLIGGWMIPTYGWRFSYLILALVTMIFVIPISLLVIKTKPSDIGLCIDGESANTTADQISKPARQGLVLKEAAGTISFWMIGFGFMIFSIPQLGVMQNQVPHLSDIGYNITLAASALGVVGLMSGVGKLLFGYLCDKMPVKIVTMIGFGLQLCGILLFLTMNKESSISYLYFYAVIFGLGAGCWLPLLGFTVAKYFGLGHYGAIFGVLALMQVTGAAIGPFLGGAMYDALGSYSKIFAIFAVLNAVSVVCIALLPSPRSPKTSG